MILDITTAPPPFIATAAKGAEELKKRMAKDNPAAARMIDMITRYAGISKRHIVIPDAEENPVDALYSGGDGYVVPDTGKRMALYEQWSTRLGCQAVSQLIENNKVNPNEIEHLITISCTGFFAPGQDYAIIKHLGLNRAIRRTNIGFMGCAASLIGFTNAVAALKQLSSPQKKILLVSLELCSLHMQTEPTKDNILANLLFADGCAAVLFGNSSDTGIRFAVEDTYSFLFEDSNQYMGWKVGSHGFQMILSQELPQLIAAHAVPALKQWLKSKGYIPEDIQHWAIHPGGKAIIKAVEDGFGLTAEQTASSYKTLADYGNMSSASILYVLKDILDSKPIKQDELCCAVAFGPGLTMEAAILRGK